MSGSERGAREEMSNVDTAWLRMESPTNLMMITGVWMLDGKLALKKLKQVVVSRFLAYRRFRQKAVDDGSSAFWQTDADFDIETVKGGFNVNTVVPAGYEEELAEQIPMTKIRSQRRLTTSVLKNWAASQTNLERSSSAD